jgi:dTDP-4-dehydrorhamnose 3,5-epimerase
MSTPFVPGSAYGVRWDDPAFGIAWPDPPPGGRILNERDASYPDVSATT